MITEDNNTMQSHNMADEERHGDEEATRSVDRSPVLEVRNRENNVT